MEHKTGRNISKHRLLVCPIPQWANKVWVVEANSNEYDDSLFEFFENNVSCMGPVPKEVRLRQNQWFEWLEPPPRHSMQMHDSERPAGFTRTTPGLSSQVTAMLILFSSPLWIQGECFRLDSRLIVQRDF